MKREGIDGRRKGGGVHVDKSDKERNKEINIVLLFIRLIDDQNHVCMHSLLSNLASNSLIFRKFIYPAGVRPTGKCEAARHCFDTLSFIACTTAIPRPFPSN